MAIMTPPRPRGRRPKDARVTPEDLLDMEDGHRFELIDGKLVERNMGQESSEVGFTINGRLAWHRKIDRGWLGGNADCGFRIFADPTMVRFADGSFTARSRLPGGVGQRGHSTIAPDLVFEVVSPNDKADDVSDKAALWLTAGVRLVWVVYPVGRYVQIWRANGEIETLREGQELTGEEVIPGFTMPVADIFEPLDP